MDGEAVLLCSDDILKSELKLVLLSDILALKNFVMKRTCNSLHGESQKHKESLAKAIRQSSSSTAPLKKAKSTRLVHIGWQHFNEKKGKYTNVRKGGGARSIDLPKSSTVSDIITAGKRRFFTNGVSVIGHESQFEFLLGNYAGKFLADQDKDFTLEKYISDNDLSHIRLYLLTRKKKFVSSMIFEDEGEDDDFELPNKICEKCNSTYHYVCMNCSYNEELTEEDVEKSVCECGRTLKDGYCLPCQQDLEYKRSLEIDKAKEATNESQKRLEINEGNVTVEENETASSVDEVRKARIQRFAPKPIRYRHSIGSPGSPIQNKTSDEAELHGEFVKENIQKDLYVFGDDEIKRFFEENNDTCNNVISTTDTIKHIPSDVVLLEARDIHRNIQETKTVIVQREKERFWPVILRQNIDFSEKRPNIRFAGEAAADTGGPLREFCTLAMAHLPSVGRMFFGQPLVFTAAPDLVNEKAYFKVAQVCALSILELGRGPECFHASVVRELFGIEHPVVIEPIDDYIYNNVILEVEHGKIDSLLDRNISPAGRDEITLKRLSSLSYLVNERFIAIDQFKHGLQSIAPSLFVKENYQLLRNYFESNSVEYTFDDVIKIISYPQTFQEGSNSFQRFKNAQAEFEMFLSAVEIGDVSSESRKITLNDILFFITGSDRIPPFGFHKSIDIEFCDVSLPKATTCGLILQVPWENLAPKFIMAIEYGLGFGNV